MRTTLLPIIILTLLIVFGFKIASAQVDQPATQQDTLYLYEEEVIYDTLYLYDSLPQPSLMNKEELIETVRKNHDIGNMYYSKGRLFLSGGNGLYRLENDDVKELFNISDYDDYRKARRNIILGNTFYAIGGGMVALTALGIGHFSYSFHNFGTMDDSGFWKDPKYGAIFMAVGGVGTLASLITAVTVSNRGKGKLRVLAGKFNAATTMRLSFSPTPCGAGLTLSF